MGAVWPTLEDELRAAFLGLAAQNWNFKSLSPIPLIEAVLPLVETKLRELDNELNTEIDDLQGELNDVRQVLAELDVPVNPMLSLRRHVKYMIQDLRNDVAAARRERDEHRKATDALKVDYDLACLARDDAERLVERWTEDYQRAVEQASAWQEDARQKAAELTAIRELLRGVTDGAQYEDISILQCIQQVVDARDAAIDNWGRCHRRHLDLEGRTTSGVDHGIEETE